MPDSRKRDKRNRPCRETKQRRGVPSHPGATPRKLPRCEKKGGYKDRLLRIADVQEMTGLSRASVYKMVADGRLPPPVRLSSRCVRWRESELEATIDALPRS